MVHYSLNCEKKVKFLFEIPTENVSIMLYFVLIDFFFLKKKEQGHVKNKRMIIIIEGDRSHLACMWQTYSSG